jgi:hypothetical protein
MEGQRKRNAYVFNTTLLIMHPKKSSFYAIIIVEVELAEFDLENRLS